MSTQTLPSIRIMPAKALADRRVDIRLGGFEPGQVVTVRAHMRDDLNRLWLSYAHFKSGRSGDVDLSSQAPISGTYKGADPMGLIWSMSLDHGEGQASRFLKKALTPIVITVTAEVGWEPVATAGLERLYVTPDVTRVPVHERHLAGTFFHPQEGGPHPGVIVLGAADGGIYEGVAARLASQGFAALSLAYFGIDHLSPHLANIPLEYFKAALAWLVAQPQVDGDRAALLGWSRGGEAALLVSAVYPQLVRAVAAYVPSSFMLGSMAHGLPNIANAQASWSYGGRPLPFLPIQVPGSRFHVPDGSISPGTWSLEPGTPSDGAISLRPLYEAALSDRDAMGRAAIPVEHIDCPVLLISGEEDAMWPSTPMCKLVMERLARHNRPHQRKHLSYPHAGHTIGIPYRPTTVTEHLTPAGTLLQFGGTAEGNAHAEADSWPQVLDFLRTDGFGIHK